MAVGRKPTDQSTEPRPGYVSALQGRDGRTPAPPEGELYVRDPAAARADAIREKVALYKSQGLPIPEHLQHMYDSLPANGNSDIELVDATTGAHVAEVDDGEPHAPEPVATFESYKVPAPIEELPTGTPLDELIDAKVPVEEVIEARVPVNEPVEVVPPVANGGAGVLSVAAEPVTVEPAPVLSVAAEPVKPEPEALNPVPPVAPLPPMPPPRPRGRPRKTPPQ